MRRKKVILLVEPSELRLSTRKFLLQTKGYRVLAVRYPGEALEIVLSHIPGAIDVMVTDLHLPVMNGFELVHRAVAHNAHLRTIIVSDIVRTTPDVSPSDIFLPKGHTSAELLERLRVLVQRKRGPKIGWKTAKPIEQVVGHA
jgi:two-component system response regulator CpxR